MTNFLHASRQAVYFAKIIGIGLFLFLATDGRAQSEGVCAKVALRLDQSAVMTRTAFRATLELSNNDLTSVLRNVAAQIEIKDATGQSATNRFQVEAPTLENIDSIGGTGTIAGNTKATIRWL